MSVNAISAHLTCHTRLGMLRVIQVLVRVCLVLLAVGRTNRSTGSRLCFGRCCWNPCYSGFDCCCALLAAADAAVTAW
ncbi:hypothetical protein B0O80DRAFT_464152 [Mortierella sp. GBAus27b]|nr:hypothetical protein B0O80DRAFT_464152 [Mortierella sp. GBAus27b]